MFTGSHCLLIQQVPTLQSEKYNLPFNDDIVMEELQNRSSTTRNANSGANEQLSWSSTQSWAITPNFSHAFWGNSSPRTSTHPLISRLCPLHSSLPPQTLLLLQKEAPHLSLSWGCRLSPHMPTAANTWLCQVPNFGCTSRWHRWLDKKKDPSSDVKSTESESLGNVFLVRLS